MKRSEKKFIKHMDKLLLLLTDLFADQHLVESTAACCGYIGLALSRMHAKDRRKMIPILSDFIRQMEKEYADAE
jgi:hypothetical protein